MKTKITHFPRLITILTVWLAVLLPAINVCAETSPMSYSISAISSDNNMGTVSGAGRYAVGDTIVLTATPKANYHFAYWSNGKRTPTISVPVYGDSSLIAYFGVGSTSSCSTLEIPFSYGFDDAPSNYDQIPCWNKAWSSGPGINTSNGYPNGGKCLIFEYHENSNHAQRCAILPQIDVSKDPINTLKLGLWIKADKPGNAGCSSHLLPYNDIVIGIMNNPNDISTFQQVTFIKIAFKGYNHYYVDLSSYEGAGSYIAIKTTGFRPSCTEYDYIDNITIDTIEHAKPDVYGAQLDYLNFNSLKNGSLISLYQTKSIQSINLLYSTDSCVSWNEYSIGDTLVLDSGNRIFFKPKTFNTSLEGYRFSISGRIEGNGNIMSLVDGALERNTLTPHCFDGLFMDCAGLIKSPRLPAISMSAYGYASMFENCVNLELAPELPATQMNHACYFRMFRGCTKLINAPELPAIKLFQRCYYGMFENCTSLRHIPDLQSTQLEEYCYASMFNGCTSLKINLVGPGKEWKIPDNARYYYSDPEYGWGNNMFSNTSGSLLGQPQIGTQYYITCNYPISALANDSLKGYTIGSGTYLEGSTAILVAVPNEHCHFVGWSNGETNDTLSFEVLSDTSLIAYFEYDTIEVSAKVNIDSAGHIIGAGMYEYNSEVTLTAIPETNHSFICWNDGDTNKSISFTALQDTMVEAFFDERPYKVSATASYENCIVLGSGYYERNSIVTLTAKSNKLYRFVRWSNGSTDSIVQFNVISDTSFIAYYEHTPYDYLYFKAIDGPASVSLTKVGNPNAISLQYSIDNCISWNTYSINQTIQLENDEKVYFKATTTNSVFSPSDKNLYRFVMTGNVAAGGNVMSLLDETLQQTSVPNYAFCELFSGCSSLITPPLLPATSVGYGGYAHMFAHCGNLKYAPNLPATSLGGWCYSEIFQDCSSIYVNLSGTGTQWSIPSNAVTQNGWGYQMFVGTSGTLRGAPTVGQIYYMQGLHNVSVSVNDTNMGVVIGGGQYYDGATATLIAIAKPNCHFVNWSNGKTSATINVTVFGDSTLTATFAPNETYLFGETDTICQGETYNWHGKTFSTAGIYYDSLKTQYGSDSVYELTLTVNSTYLFQETYSICQGETYSWRSKNLTTSGVYYDSLKTVAGCDSVYELTLTVNPTYFFPETYSICQVRLILGEQGT